MNILKDFYNNDIKEAIKHIDNIIDNKRLSDGTPCVFNSRYFICFEGVKYNLFIDYERNIDYFIDGACYEEFINTRINKQLTIKDYIYNKLGIPN